MEAECVFDEDICLQLQARFERMAEKQRWYCGQISIKGKGTQCIDIHFSYAYRDPDLVKWEENCKDWGLEIEDFGASFEQRTRPSDSEQETETLGMWQVCKLKRLPTMAEWRARFKDKDSQKTDLLREFEDYKCVGLRQTDSEKPHMRWCSKKEYCEMSEKDYEPSEPRSTKRSHAKVDKPSSSQRKKARVVGALVTNKE